MVRVTRIGDIEPVNTQTVGTACEVVIEPDDKYLQVWQVLSQLDGNDEGVRVRVRSWLLDTSLSVSLRENEEFWHDLVVV